MVRIINGEIVQDDDPRLKQRRPQEAAPAARPKFGGVHSPSSPSARQAAPAAPAAGGGGGASPLSGLLDPLATTLGIAGQSVAIPALGPIPAGEVELVHLALVGAGTLFIGFRAILVAALAYAVVTHSKANPAAPAAATPAR